MNYSEDEKKLKQLFQSLKARDEKETPPFSRLWQTAINRQEQKPLFIIPKPVLVVMSLAIIVLAIFLGRRDSKPEVLLSQWHSPTSYLLKKTGSAPFSNTHLLSNENLASPWQSPTIYLGDEIK